MFLLSSLPGLAHSPYFSDWSCQSEEGYSLRLLYGDGIFGPDPASVVALDQGGHLLAIQPIGYGSFPLAGPECQIADPDIGAIWSPVIENFEVGVQLLGDFDETSEARWQFEPGVRKTSYGFEQSPLNDASFLEVVSSEITYKRIAAAIIAISAYALLVSLAGLVGQVRFDGSAPRRVLFGIMWLVPPPVFALLSLVIVLFDTPSIQLFSLSASVGGALAVASIWLHSRFRWRSLD